MNNPEIKYIKIKWISVQQTTENLSTALHLLLYVDVI